MSALIDLLTHYKKQTLNNTNSATERTDSSLSVAVIGYANVGKSSVINTLTRTKAVGVSMSPGSNIIITIHRVHFLYILVIRFLLFSHRCVL